MDASYGYTIYSLANVEINSLHMSKVTTTSSSMDFKVQRLLNWLLKLSGLLLFLGSTRQSLDYNKLATEMCEYSLQNRTFFFFFNITSLIIHAWLGYTIYQKSSFCSNVLYLAQLRAGLFQLIIWDIYVTFLDSWDYPRRKRKCENEKLGYYLYTLE